MKASALHDREPVIVEAVRTAVGRKGGGLSRLHASALLAQTLQAVCTRAGVPRGAVDDVVAGCAAQVGEQAGNIARTALLAGGFPFHVPGMTVTRACGSSQQAVHLADNLIRAGTCDVVIAGGVELMSRTAGGNDDRTFGSRYPPALVERLDMPTMGMAAERIAQAWKLDRAHLDELALRSHSLAAKAQDEGHFDAQIVPIDAPAADGQLQRFERDEGVRRDTSLAKLAGLASSFQADGRVTAGNASQVSDGASAMLLMTAAKAREFGLRPRARLAGQLVVGVEPRLMLTGPIPATRAILQRCGLRLADIDLFECNEAFASVLGAWLAEIEPDLDRVNVNGGSIALGHPLGSTGARLMTTLLFELERRGGHYGLQTMCCGGAMGTATVLERVD